jgi:hypothetical protein
MRRAVLGVITAAVVVGLTLVALETDGSEEESATDDTEVSQTTRVSTTPPGDDPAAACAEHDPVTAELDGDGRPDLVSHAWVDDHAVLAMCTASGTVETTDGRGQTEVLQVIDVEPDGRAEVLFGSTTMSAAITSIAVLRNEQIVVLAPPGTPYFDLQDGALELDDAGTPTATAAFGCEDVVGDSRRELIQVVATYSATGVRWSKEAYEIDGAVVRSVHHDEGTEPPSGPDRFGYPRSLTQPC